MSFTSLVDYKSGILEPKATLKLTVKQKLQFDTSLLPAIMLMRYAISYEMAQIMIKSRQ